MLFVSDLGVERHTPYPYLLAGQRSIEVSERRLAGEGGESETLLGTLAL